MSAQVIPVVLLIGSLRTRWTVSENPDLPPLDSLFSAMAVQTFPHEFSGVKFPSTRRSFGGYVCNV